MDSGPSRGPESPLTPSVSDTGQHFGAEGGEAGKALTDTGAAWPWPGTQAEAPWERACQSCKAGVGTGRLSGKKQQRRSPKNAPQGWAQHSNWTGGAWARGGPAWKFPHPPYSLLHPHPQVPEEHISQDTVGPKK